MLSTLKRIAHAVGIKRDARIDLIRALPKRAVGVEIGVHQGDYTRLLLDRASPTTLHLVDPWEYFKGEDYDRALFGGKAGGQDAMDARHDDVCERFAAEIGSGQVVINRCYSSDFLSAQAEGSLDWVYIDGNHLYEFVKNDLWNSFRAVRSGGKITGDDYDAGGWWEGGVKRAVDEFVEEAAVKVDWIRHRQFVLTKR